MKTSAIITKPYGNASKPNLNDFTADWDRKSTTGKIGQYSQQNFAGILVEKA